MFLCSIQFSSLDRLGRRGDLRDDSAEILFQYFLLKDTREQFRHRQGRPLFDIVRPAFALLDDVNLHEKSFLHVVSAAVVVAAAAATDDDDHHDDHDDDNDDDDEEEEEAIVL